MNIHIQTNHTVPLLRVQAQVVQSRPCANASATLYSSARQRAYLGNTCSTSYRIAASSRRIGAATLQAALDNYVADVPVAGQQAKWYALVANAEFMLHDVQNEAFAEQLRERVRLFGEKSRKQDFFLVCEPKWLEEQFPEEAKRIRRPCVALVSTDKIWITFMKLRLDRVMKLELGELTPEQALKAGADFPEFPPLDKAKWTAPYSPYRPGWWKAFDPSVFFGSGASSNGSSSSNGSH